MPTCAAIPEDAARLACYDAQPVVPLVQGSPLTRLWDLEADPDFDVNVLRPHKPNYMMPVTWMAHPDARITPNGSDLKTLDSVEAKYQLSFKFRLSRDLLGNGDLWFGYTQQSFWQVYNKAASAPFRETNYEPELMFAWRTRLHLGEMKVPLVGISLNHQSNGRSEPQSRSWNRLILLAGAENERTVLSARLWHRFRESAADDDNPGVEDFIGRGEVFIAHKLGQSVYHLNLRHSLRTGQEGRGSATLGWTYPLGSGVKGYVQVFHGYGESLLDYNVKDTRVGLGFLLSDWM